jgi:hypothetical protein
MEMIWIKDCTKRLAVGIDTQENEEIETEELPGELRRGPWDKYCGQD